MAEKVSVRRQALLNEAAAALGVELQGQQLDQSASFVQLGGHSLAAAVLAAACKRRGLHVSVASILSSPSLAVLADAAVAAATAPPLLSVSAPPPATSPAVGPVQKVQPTERLTELQESLLQGSLNDPRTNFIYYCETYPPHAIPAVKSAWTQVVAAEAIFRAHTYSADENTSHRNPELPSTGLDWREVESPSETAYRRARDDCDGLFDTTTSSTPQRLNLEIQFRVITLPGRRSTVVWRVHHALIDGYSAGLIFRKLRQARRGLPVIPGPSFSAAADELRQLQQLRAPSGNAYWQDQRDALQAGSRELLLPAPEAPRAGAACGEVVASMRAFPSRAQECARALGITPASIVYAAWALVLSIYTDADETVVGAVMSGRNLDIAHVDQVVGPLINTLPFYQKLNRAATNRELLQSTFARMVELSTYQWTTPANGFTRDFASALAVQFDLPPAQDEDADLLEPPYTKIESSIPLSVMVEGRGDVRIVYHTARYNHADMERMARCFCDAVDALLRPDAQVQTTIDSLITTEDQGLLRTFGNCGSGLTTRAAVKDDLVTLFERAARETPDGIAVQQGDETLTYAELDARASSMAAALCIAPQQVVCVHSERSIAWIVAIWAILKGGGVYCSLDPALPAEMRDQIYTAAGARLYVSPTHSGLAAAPRTAASTFDAHGFLAGGVGIGHRTRSEPWQPAYLCFTSGSTGRPKGVLCTHEGLVAFQRDLEVRLFAQPGRRVAQFMSVAFDGSIHEIFSTLCYGASLVLGSGPDPFAALRDVDSALMTPSIAAVLDPTDFPTLQTVYLVGERVPQAVADNWGAATDLYNMYGPTEGTGGATIKRLLPGRPVTIGRPNPSSRVYILDSHRARVPPGVIGEVYLAGVQVARGYIGMEAETRARFLPDPVCPGLDENMYCTGDRGYWNADGELVFLGRRDRQIKLRGFRVDLEDVEARIRNACKAVTAVAVAQAADKTNPVLVAMVQPANVSIDTVRRAATRALPSHAVPHRIIAVDVFPVTKTGKLDYSAVSSAKQGSVDTPALRSPSERRLAALWRKVLGCDEAGDLPLDGNSDFIALGGHSLSQLRLANQLSAAYGRKVPVRMVVECRTLRSLAAALDELAQTDAPAPALDRRLGEHELSPIELEWWDKYALDTSSSAFNVSTAGTFTPGTVDRARLADAWNTVLATHRILRGRYIARKRQVRRVYAANPPQVERVHEINVWAEINRPFVLSEQAPVRVFITSTQMVVVMSHIVCDLTTMKLLLDHVSALYRGLPVPEAGSAYTDSTAWHRPAPPCHLDYWNGVYPSVKTPETSRTDYRGKSMLFSLPPAAWHAMQSFCQQRNMTFQQLSIAAVALAMSNPESGADLTLGLPYINRNSEADLGTVGLFLEPLPVRIEYSPEDHGDTAGAYLNAVQNASRKSLSFAVPWHQLLEHLHIDPDYPNHPLFETMVTFHDEHSPSSSDNIPGIDPCFVWTEGAKFQLMCEFTAVSEDVLVLRVEHDSELFSDADILRLENGITMAVECLTSADGDFDARTFTDMKQRMREGEDEAKVRPSAERLRNDLFGVEMRLLK